MNIIRCPKCKYDLISEEYNTHICKEISDYKIEKGLVFFYDGELWYPSFFLKQPKSNTEKTTDKETEPLGSSRGVATSCYCDGVFDTLSLMVFSMPWTAFSFWSSEAAAGLSAQSIAGFSGSANFSSVIILCHKVLKYVYHTTHMSKRITIMMDDENDTKLRKLQAQQIQKTNSSVSYSKMLNTVLEKAL